jgi:SAM-dependent methyltransferase
VVNRVPIALVTIALAACAGAVAPAPTPAPSTSAHPEPFAHRFEHADEWARVFDDPARDEWQKPADVVTSMHVSPGATVADVGAGTGYFEPWLSRAVGPSGVLYAVDVEPDMVRYLRERAARDHLDNVRPVLAGPDDANLPARGVDRVLVVDTWHHVPGRVAYARRLAGALATGGTITFVEFTMDAPMGPPQKHRIPADVLIGELREAGLAAERVDVGLRWQYVVVARAS